MTAGLGETDANQREGQFPVLLSLWEEDGLTQSKLHRLTDVEQATMANTLQRMERDGLVRRTRHPSDQRQALVRLTPKARGLEPPLVRSAQEVNEATLAGFSMARKRSSLRACGKRSATHRPCSNIIRKTRRGGTKDHRRRSHGQSNRLGDAGLRQTHAAATDSRAPFTRATDACCIATAFVRRQVQDTPIDDSATTGPRALIGRTAPSRIGSHVLNGTIVKGRSHGLVAALRRLAVELGSSSPRATRDLLQETAEHPFVQGEDAVPVGAAQ